MLEGIGKSACQISTQSNCSGPLAGWVLLGGGTLLAGGIVHCLWGGNCFLRNLPGRKVSLLSSEDTATDDPFASLDLKSKKEIEQILQDGIPIFKWAIFSNNAFLFIKLVRKGFEYKIKNELRIEYIRFVKKILASQDAESNADRIVALEETESLYRKQIDDPTFRIEQVQPSPQALKGIDIVVGMQEVLFQMQYHYLTVKSGSAFNFAFGASLAPD